VFHAKGGAYLDCDGLPVDDATVNLAKATLPHLCQRMQTTRGQGDVLRPHQRGWWHAAVLRGQARRGLQQPLSLRLLRTGAPAVVVLLAGSEH
jgi:hypothetical protein